VGVIEDVTEGVWVIEGVTDGVRLIDGVTVGVMDGVMEIEGVTECDGEIVGVIDGVGIGEAIILLGGSIIGAHQFGSSGSNPPVGTGSEESQRDPVQGSVGSLDPGPLWRI
jgi:hypothetical protein